MVEIEATKGLKKEPFISLKKVPGTKISGDFWSIFFSKNKAAVTITVEDTKSQIGDFDGFQ